MNRALRHLLIAVALLFAQQGAYLHVFSHFPSNARTTERGEKETPPLGHLAAQCLVFHAVDSALPNLSSALQPLRVAPPTAAYFVLPLPFQPRIEFDSRAPPVLS